VWEDDGGPVHQEINKNGGVMKLQRKMKLHCSSSLAADSS